MLKQPLSIFVFVQQYMKVFMQLSNAISSLQLFPNINCEPFEDVVETNSLGYKYYPYYIKLHRCRGANYDGIQPERKICSPVESKLQKINVSVINLQAEKGENILLYNHTECEYKCKKDSSVCSKYETWNEYTCSCICNVVEITCHTPLMWDKTRCQCMCPEAYISYCKRKGKGIDSKTCNCIDIIKPSERNKNDGIQVHILILIIVLELVIVALTVTAINYCCCYRKKSVKFVFSNDSKIALKNDDSTSDNSVSFITSNENTFRARFI